jgi:hypothetical protein
MDIPSATIQSVFNEDKNEYTKMTMQDQVTGKFKNSRVRLNIPKGNVNLYQDAIICMVFKTTIDDEDGSRGTYIGTALIGWKQAIEEVQDGASPVYRFSAELTDFLSDQLSGMNQVAPSGEIEGRLQWAEPGSDLYKPQKQPAPVSDDGTLRVTVK